ncbi:MAG: ATP-binding protein [bacterium]|nr:ATP-binding protein [bacterium]
MPVNEMIQISVHDTGIGIAEENKKKVFEEFVQIDSSYSRQYAGTGLGLPLTKKLVELHGGKNLVRE